MTYETLPLIVSGSTRNQEKSSTNVRLVEPAVYQPRQLLYSSAGAVCVGVVPCDSAGTKKLHSTGYLRNLFENVHITIYERLSLFTLNRE